MRLDFTGQRLLAVVAHPDDVELLCAGTLARAKSDGAEIAICTMCRGDKGGAAECASDLAEERRREAVAAATLLGAKTFFTDVADGQLADTPEIRKTLVRVYRDFRPTSVLSHDPEDYHSDHRAAAALAEAASWFACSAGHDARHVPLAKPPAVYWMDTVNMLGFEPGFFVDVSDFLTLKQDMLKCHRSQLQRGKDPDFEPLEQLMRRQAAARGAQAGVAAAEAFRIHLAWKRVCAW